MEAVKKGLDAGADVNAKDEDKWTPLHVRFGKVARKPPNY